MDDKIFVVVRNTKDAVELKGGIIINATVIPSGPIYALAKLIDEYPNRLGILQEMDEAAYFNSLDLWKDNVEKYVMELMTAVES